MLDTSPGYWLSCQGGVRPPEGAGLAAAIAGGAKFPLFFRISATRRRLMVDTLVLALCFRPGRIRDSRAAKAATGAEDGASVEVFAMAAMSDQNDRHLDDFIRMLTEHQVDLQAFIMSSLGNYSDTQDVLQLTNIALWKKASTFRSGAPFLPWALKVAKYEILAFIRKRRRDRHTFSPELVELMVDVAVQRGPELPKRSSALYECIKKLPERSREFLQIRYAQQQSIKQIAEKTGRSVDAVKSVYLRIRRALQRCIDRRVAAETRS